MYSFNRWIAALLLSLSSFFLRFSYSKRPKCISNKLPSSFTAKREKYESNIHQDIFHDFMLFWTEKKNANPWHPRFLARNINAMTAGYKATRNLIGLLRTNPIKPIILVQILHSQIAQSPKSTAEAWRKNERIWIIKFRTLLSYFAYQKAPTFRKNIYKQDGMSNLHNCAASFVYLAQVHSAIG